MTNKISDVSTTTKDIIWLPRAFSIAGFLCDICNSKIKSLKVSRHLNSRNLKSLKCLSRLFQVLVSSRTDSFSRCNAFLWEAPPHMCSLWGQFGQMIAYSGAVNYQNNVWFTRTTTKCLVAPPAWDMASVCMLVPRISKIATICSALNTKWNKLAHFGVFCGLTNHAYHCSGWRCSCLLSFLHWWSDKAHLF